MGLHLGRRIRRPEQVHHAGPPGREDKWQNHLSMLVYCADQYEHAKYHSKLRVSEELKKCGGFCGLVKPVSEFHPDRDPRRSMQYQRRCKQCQKEARAAARMSGLEPGGGVGDPVGGGPGKPPPTQPVSDDREV
jgi:hypothetical protein